MGLSIKSKSLKVKLQIAFYLTSLIPLLFLGYIVFFQNTYVSYQYVLFAFLVALIIASSGYCLMKNMIFPVIDVSNKARAIASGNSGFQVEIEAEDEIGDLNIALDKLNDRIRDNIKELDEYSKRTNQINSDLNKKIMSLSALLQIGSFISSSAKIDQVLGLIIEKVSLIQDNNSAMLFILDDKTNEFELKYSAKPFDKGLESLRIKQETNVWHRLMHDKESLVIDSNSINEILKIEGVPDLINEIKAKNCIIFPIVLQTRTKAILVISNSNNDFCFTEDDLEIVRLFSKQIAIAIENDFLTKRAHELETNDEATGVFNERFIRARLDEEIKRAVISQRPCAFIIFKIDNFQFFRQCFGQGNCDDVLKKIARILIENSRNIDKVARFGLFEFALLLPELNKRQALEFAQTVRDRIVSSFKSEDKDKRITVSAAVSENPIDGASADELIKHAKGLFENAQAKIENRILS